MKLITAIIQPGKFDEVRDALVRAGAEGMTVSEVNGCGQQRGYTEVYRGARYQVNLISKVRVEIAVRDADVDRLVDLIVATARTGQIGDGKVWVTPLDSVTRVRTGETGAAAL